MKNVSRQITQGCVATIMRGKLKARGFVISILVIPTTICKLQSETNVTSPTLARPLISSTDFRKLSKRSLMKIVVLLFSTANLGGKIT